MASVRPPSGGARIDARAGVEHEEVVAALPPAECAEAMASVLAAHSRGEAYMPLRSIMVPPGAAGFMGLMPAWRGGPQPLFSLKTVCILQGTPVQVLGKLIAQRQLPSSGTRAAA